MGYVETVNPDLEFTTDGALILFSRYLVFCLRTLHEAIVLLSEEEMAIAHSRKLIAAVDKGVPFCS